MQEARLTLVIPRPAPSREDELLEAISRTDSTPSFMLRVILGEYRRRGVDFDAAWSSAIRSLPRPSAPAAAATMDEWKKALGEAKPVYRAAYTGEAPEPRFVELEGLVLLVGVAA